ncbi:MAG: FAD-binding protein [Bacteroidaceae bacterium]|nr:FAD-binding protein [Bacteroidaceae bacterium]
MIKELQIKLPARAAASNQDIKKAVETECGIKTSDITALRILKKSIDARNRTIYVNLTLRLFINENPPEHEYIETVFQNVEDKPSVVIVGAGPGGLFAALKLIEQGLKPVIVERGKDVHARKVDIANISRTDTVNPESNYCFGEGGAGAYSDGKLFTRSKKRGDSESILHLFCQHGADASILYDSHPHIGTDRLPRVIENIRNTITKCGGEIHFETKMTSLLLHGDTVEGIQAVTSAGLELEFRGPVILATGHSARDIYRYLNASHIEIQAKNIAVGCRLEHPQHIIDCIQYHTPAGRGDYLPAAEYSFVTQVEGRGVYSFCMCPGGFVVPAASGPEQIVVNGMSPSGRNSKWANSGMVVETHVEDVAKCDADMNNPLILMEFQQELEKQCWIAGFRHQTAPAQRMTDFVNNRLSADLAPSSYSPGLVSSPLHFWMPEFISNRLKSGFKYFGSRAHGFLSGQATVIGVETRTSTPVRIMRDNDSLQHVRLKGLYPCGEGAGYAGGIVSAAVDGQRCALAVSNTFI